MNPTYFKHKKTLDFKPQGLKAFLRLHRLNDKF